MVIVLETLRTFDAFLPRINFGKIKPALHHPNGGGGVPAQSAGEAGFSYLKRDLVRLLGILCYNTKAMQDRVRLCGGIPVVLNLCVIDDRNPCKPFPFSDALARVLWRGTLAPAGLAPGLGIVTHTHTLRFGGLIVDDPLFFRPTGTCPLCAAQFASRQFRESGRR